MSCSSHVTLCPGWRHLDVWFISDAESLHCLGAFNGLILVMRNGVTYRQTQPFIGLGEENHDVTITMSSSCADPMLGFNILQG